MREYVFPEGIVPSEARPLTEYGQFQHTRAQREVFQRDGRWVVRWTFEED